VHDGAETLRTLSRPFLTWTGKAERLSFDVPTLPLFVHERLSTKAIVETLVGHKTDKQTDLWELLGDPRHSITDQVLKAYEYPDKWVNRLILGDSLVVMNSLLHYERLGGQVQMIYIDPPYGVKFGSNFQPFVRKRDVSHGDDEDLTREPEMVKAYRDTWELGLHSYLTYMRDRLLLARELLTPSGSVFVQISDENLHHVRELMDEVFGEQNFVSLITFQKTTGQTSGLLPGISDYLLWYARDRERTRFRQLFTPIRPPANMGLVPATYVQATPDLMMGDLLKHMRSSQIFSVCGLPEIKIHKAKLVSAGAPSRYEMELVGLDTFDPTTMATEHIRGDDVPCWMLDADYNGLCFRASQVFFPRTAAWDSLKKALKADYEESVWDHLAGARSAPFEAGEQKQVAVKVIDDRGNELLVVKALP
jgi:hypothetical protein